MYYHLQKRKEMIFFLLNRVNIIQHGQLKWIERRDIVDNQRKSRADNRSCGRYDTCRVEQNQPYRCDWF